MEDKLESLEWEMALFLKNNQKRYGRFMEKIKEKYQSLGVIGGTIIIKNINDEERNLLCKIDSKYLEGKDCKITVKKFFGIFNNTKFAQCDFEDVLKLYFDNNLQTSKERQRIKEENKEKFFQGILDEFSNTPGGNWLKNVLSQKEYGYQRIIREYEEDKGNLKTVLQRVIVGLNTLYNFDKKERLAIFSSKITKDPHFFDDGTLAGQLLLYGLAYFSKISFPENSEEKIELLYSYGLFKDEVSNYTLCGNIEAFTSDGKHLGIEGFVVKGEPIQLNLWNLAALKKITCRKDVIFVFENPSVFSEVLLKTKNLKPSLLCTAGVVKLASLAFLDKVVEHGGKIYYSGDFDPEGLLIGDKLKKRYNENLIFWRYDIENYFNSLSTKAFDDQRRKKLEKITSSELTGLVNEMAKKGLCGYQELLIDYYLQDISCFLDL
ncbi:TIGR02679 family protein [Anaerobranca californiensis DSM 14826]|uniref:TIGR02679 family protein n=1 Tax=Anaerobranca californiensis DSM 14826 TaxID=1120989 RepID=A0A1M6PC95_9FIRM|nr:TIGR02679 domain-containing protein [Anaerobranca californiensis]SHK05500.1 TIGR02679 family protein [Anaerobranca californiensis DSM 14826]